MAKKEKKAELATNPVAWVDGKPIKYQSSLSYQVSEERIIRLIGDPMSTEKKALESLQSEVTLWNEAVESFNKVGLQKEG